MKLIAYAALALLLPQEKNAAEETFKRIEEKLLKAESIQVAFKTSFEQQRKSGEKVSGLLSGSILLQSGDKARFEIDGRIGIPISEFIVSDGKMTRSAGKEAPILSSPTSPTLNRDAILRLARTGAVPAVMETGKELALAEMDRRKKESGETPEPRATDLPKTMRLRDFKSGPVEKIDGRDAGAIQFVVEDVVRSGKALVTLWFDSETLLPIRRRVMDEEKGILIEETFTLFKLDEKIDPAKFELPKAK